MTALFSQCKATGVEVQFKGGLVRERLGDQAFLYCQNACLQMMLL